MRHIFGAYAYGAGPRTGCWWDETAPLPDWPAAEGALKADVVVIGGGFTGLNAALTLAQAGTDVVVLDAMYPGWGASGRNGGFCCLGGGRRSFKSLAAEFGPQAAHDFFATERASIDHVGALLDRFSIDADRHSNGETKLAHTKSRLQELEREADEIATEGWDNPVVTGPADLPGIGIGGNFHGALTVRTGFALNPRKYVLGLAAAAAGAGARIFAQSPVTGTKKTGNGWTVSTPAGTVTADAVLIATNGYSSEDLPDWLSARYMPAQSTVLVTRPITAEEQAAQGWTTDQMCYDTRRLLHYFRLMPDGRFLFGMRGGIRSTPGAEAQARARTRRDFDRMFPQWAGVSSTHSWSGFVCLARRLMPFVGAVPGSAGMYAAMAYHGNGVAMGSLSGHLMARQILGHDDEVPVTMRRPLTRFPFGRFRRVVMPAAYASYALADL
ncbi:NAD(P)/FAD-dependent oxidoreductase [Chachezhania sediminis]|uniref:NAD(P)/FAD-dependent oxidoreductase n=1 Tax=Chachezhania sediminis TaxID=2599291 RepID=UPI00131CBAB3|nr:FAD-binding oxidoreductase [Chachezhania sediminis]